MSTFRLQHLPIRHKLTVIAMTASGTALILAGAALVAVQIASWRPQLPLRMASMAEIIGANSTAALTFDDPRAAGEFLDALRSQRNITAACLYDRSGRPFARYQRGVPATHYTPPAPRPAVARIEGDHAVVFRPVMLDGQQIGTVYLESDLNELHALVNRSVWMVVAILLLAGGVAFALVQRLQRVISEPVLLLAETARAVSRDRDYSRRAQRTGDDEIGQLIDGFNEMLEQIQHRDASLQQHREHLEDEVARRTADLVRSEGMRVEAEKQRAHSQRLESIGQLAAGIAHEINTPLQYVGDSLQFLKNAFASLLAVAGDHRRLLDAARAQGTTPEMLDELDQALEDNDVEFIQEQAPRALQSTTEGVARVAEIVRAMKQFSHPGTQEKLPVDLNDTVKTTVTVSRNEWKYVAELVLELDDAVADIPCRQGEIRQVLLNLIINAAHAIGEFAIKNGADKSGTEKGTITVSTKRAGPWVEIRVRDTGGGIPQAIRHKVFDPFFTTKAVGRGTGQGLAIAHAIVVQGHGGTISFETEVGKGTTFIVCIPQHPNAVTAEAA